MSSRRFGVLFNPLPVICAISSNQDERRVLDLLINGSHQDGCRQIMIAV